MLNVAGSVPEGWRSDMMAGLNFHGQDFEFIATGDLLNRRAADRTAHRLQITECPLFPACWTETLGIDDLDIQFGTSQQAILSSEAPGIKQCFGHQSG